MHKIIVAVVLGAMHVTDGDTVTVNKQSYRLVDFNAPEVHGKCPSEAALARRAKARLEELVNDGATLARVRCAQGPLDKYGRMCGELTFKGTPVAQIMTAEALAEPYVCKRSCPARRDWCKP